MGRMAKDQLENWCALSDAPDHLVLKFNWSRPQAEDAIWAAIRTGRIHPRERPPAKTVGDIGGWEVHLTGVEIDPIIEVNLADVQRVLFGPDIVSRTAPNPRTDANWSKARSGPRPVKRQAVAQAMRRDIAEGRLTRRQLVDMLEKELEGRYKVSRDTARKARNEVLADRSTGC
jgi:hypothetical protein